MEVGGLVAHELTWETGERVILRSERAKVGEERGKGGGREKWGWWRQMRCWKQRLKI